LGRRNNIGIVKVILTYLAFLHRLQKKNGLTYMVKFMKSAPHNGARKGPGSSLSVAYGIITLLSW
jgi:hypothetical protein